MNMKDILEFIFQDFKHYVGALVLIVMTGGAVNVALENTSRWFTVRVDRKDRER